MWNYTETLEDILEFYALDTYKEILEYINLKLEKLQFQDPMKKSSVMVQEEMDV